MGFDAEKITDDLQSGEAERVQRALETLDQAWRRREFSPLAMPGAEILLAFGDDVPRAIVELYLSVIQNYVDFDPTPSGQDRYAALVEAMLKHGRGELSHVVARAIIADTYPGSAADHALRYVENRDLDLPLEHLGAERLVDALLGSDETRAAVIETLRRWTLLERFLEIIDAVRPRLDPSELAEIAPKE